VYHGEIDSISEYCPLDLFSGQKTRMKRAIFDLYEKPSNRFKLFKNGRLIYTENAGLKAEMEDELAAFLGAAAERALDALSALLLTTLLSPLEQEVNSPREVDESFMKLDHKSLPRDKECDVTQEPLPQGCILQKLLTLQKHAELSDHGAKDVCERLLANVDDLEVSK